MAPPLRHSRERGNPALIKALRKSGTPAFAGVTMKVGQGNWGMFLARQIPAKRSP
jgi:hypothetical protein